MERSTLANLFQVIGPTAWNSTAGKRAVPWIVAVSLLLLTSSSLDAAEGPLLAGVAKVDIANPDAGPAQGRLYAKALVLKQDSTSVAIVTIDAVAIGEIGSIKNDFLPNVRARMEKDLQIKPLNTIFNASHCHGIICRDIDEKTFEAVKLAAQNLVPVTVGVGTGHEDRISENRRLKLKSGRVVDVRHAYSMPADDAVAEVGPIDAEIGILRLDRVEPTGSAPKTLAVVYNFACHPIQGVPSGANTSDLTGFASQVIEENTSAGTIALFLQGCGGDINPVLYKDVEHPRNAEPSGNQLALSTLRGYRGIECKNDRRLRMINQTLTLPRADFADRITALEAEQARLVKSLKGTSLNLKTFLPLAVKYNLAAEYPSYYSHRYLHEQQLGREDLKSLDAMNRQNLKRYVDNILTMEEITRTQTNLDLLRKHQASNLAAGKRTIDVEVAALRIGDFTLVTFPGELTVQIGLNIKQQSPHKRTFVSGYTNGYIYYAPTSEQLLNPGSAQEDCDSILAPEWQPLFEAKAIELLKAL